MKTSRDFKRRGSSILLVIGLLVLMAMVASTFLLIVHADRQDAASIESVSPLRHVAGAGLERVLADRLADLYIGLNGPFDGIDNYYKAIDYPGQECDMGLSSGTPTSDGNDPSGILSWRHLANLAGSAPPGVNYDNVRPDNPGLFSTTGFTWNNPVGSGDAVPFYSGINDLGGRQYWLALRVEDLCGRTNVNVGGTDNWNALGNLAARVGVPMRVTDQILYTVVGSGNSRPVMVGRGTDFQNDARYDTWWANYVRRPLNTIGPGGAKPGALTDATYTPYAVPDMLMCGWGGAYPDTKFGPLHWAVANLGMPNLVTQLMSVRPYLTVWSGDRILVPQLAGNLPQRVKADLNNSPLADLYAAFYNALPRRVPGDPAFSPAEEENWRRIAGQLAVNVWDFRDIDSDVTVAKIDKYTVGGPNTIKYATDTDLQIGNDIAVNLANSIGVYGVERQPFITKLFYKATKSNPPAPAPAVITKSYSAIELYNPYVTAIQLDNYALVVGGVPTPFTAGNTIPANGGKLVICGVGGTIPDQLSAIKVAGGVVRIDLNALDLAADVKIVRKRNSSVGSIQDVVIATKPSGFPGSGFDPGITKSVAWEWDDLYSRARYAVGSLFVTSANDYTGTPPDNLGGNNGAIFPATSTNPPCPVFVRNDKFINFGELFRLLAVGPSASQGLADRLTDSSNLFNGRPALVENVASRYYPAAVPTVPLGCLLQDYVTVNSPRYGPDNPDGDGQLAANSSGTMYGRLNINTVSDIPLRAVPGVFLPAVNDGLKPQSADTAGSLIAYRDTTGYKDSGGIVRDFSGNNRQLLLGIPGLRTQRGFGSVAEAALVLGRFVPHDNTYCISSGAYASDPNGNLTGMIRSYTISDNRISDDGLQTSSQYDPRTSVQDDLSKYFSSWAWASDQLTVRSDTYLAYVGVLGATGPSSGAASGAGGNSLSDGNKRWNNNQWVNCMVVITAGPGAGQANTVVSNTSNTLNLKGNWGAGAGSTYQVMHLVKRYMAVIDRSNCRLASDTPRVLMFAEIK
jgi:hypothetical protein